MHFSTERLAKRKREENNPIRRRFPSEVISGSWSWSPGMNNSHRLFLTVIGHQHTSVCPSLLTEQRTPTKTRASDGPKHKPETFWRSWSAGFDLWEIWCLGEKHTNPQGTILLLRDALSKHFIAKNWIFSINFVSDVSPKILGRHQWECRAVKPTWLLRSPLKRSLIFISRY